MKNIDLKKAYERVFRLSFHGSSYRNTIPTEVIVRKAKELGLTPKKFIERYGIKIFYNGFDGLVLKFVKLEKRSK